jgi:hypothetical protein
MRLIERENVVTVKLMRRIAEAAAIPPKGVWWFLEKNHPGMVVGFKGKAGAGRWCAFIGDTAVVCRELRPCLNPLGSIGKRPVGPERSGAALRTFYLLNLRTNVLCLVLCIIAFL